MIVDMLQKVPESSEQKFSEIGKDFAVHVEEKGALEYLGLSILFFLIAAGVDAWLTSSLTLKIMLFVSALFLCGSVWLLLRAILIRKGKICSCKRARFTERLGNLSVNETTVPFTSNGLLMQLITDDPQRDVPRLESMFSDEARFRSRLDAYKECLANKAPRFRRAIQEASLCGVEFCNDSLLLLHFDGPIGEHISVGFDGNRFVHTP